ncbi:hypothetical protein DFS34DRAFT_348259 [Phlyctochytrium arcticum]|nr:hypothetical protein DFS34DRAFT_348259 [Phlyctochytrium arcticum]
MNFGLTLEELKSAKTKLLKKGLVPIPAHISKKHPLGDWKNYSVKDWNKSVGKIYGAKANIGVLTGSKSCVLWYIYTRVLGGPGVRQMSPFHVLALTPAQSPPTLVPMEILCFFGKSFCFSLDPILSSIDLYVFPTHRIFLGCPENRPFSTLSSHMVLCVSSASLCAQIIFLHTEDSLGRISRILLTWSPVAHRLSLGAFPLFLFQISCFLSSRPSSFRCLYIIQWWFFIPQTSVRSCGLLHEKKGLLHLLSG